MKLRDVVLVFVFLVVLIAGSMWIYKNRNQNNSDVPLVAPSISEKVSNAFPNLTIPDGADRADMESVNGGEGVGVATRQKTNSTTTVTVMANLPDPSTGFYLAEITDGTQKVTLGKLSLSKSGFLVNYTTTSDIGEYSIVTVSLNGSTVLEGSF